MASISRMKAGQYSVSDGRIIVKQGSSWYVLTKSGNNEFGPVTTLNAASQYVNSSSVPIGQHTRSSAHGRKQSKKEFNAYLAAEAKNGNYEPLIVWIICLFVICLFFVLVQGY